jgi:hypothetical protein
MDIRLKVYTTRLCRKVEREVTAPDFDLSTGVCEDVLNIINIDMFEGGLTALSEDSQQELMVEVVKNGYPFFIELIREIFELTEDEVKRVKIADVASVMMDIVRYSITQLASALGSKAKGKN